MLKEEREPANFEEEAEQCCLIFDILKIKISSCKYQQSYQNMTFLKTTEAYKNI